MKKLLSVLLVLVLLVSTLVSCGQKADKTVIAVPDDATNENRALNLLVAQGLITLNSTADGLATVRDIKDNPYNIEFKEVVAAQIPNVLKDVTCAVINANYAIEAKLTPFITEGTDVSYPNIVCVKEGNENTDLAKALVAAVNSTAVQKYIADTFKGAVVCDLVNPGDGFDPAVDYAALAGQTIKIAASPTPHAEILKAAKDVLAQKNITLQIIEFEDYVQPNTVVEEGECFANYFQHIPYLNDFNAANGTHIVSVIAVHHEPMGIYSDKISSLDSIKK
ncbi:MAG: MetQ/NlpA family ABC transporter substrate-binding protein [Clostridia bacterium]|nr:MetQ/NlpA family ABC transporter substrate-binding protein [Clostridia bacterium]